MQPLKKYILLESGVVHTASQETIEKWRAKLIEFIFNYIDCSPVTLLSLNPAASNIGNDVGQGISGILNSKKYLISHISVLGKSLIIDLLEDSDFYLGHSILSKGTLSLATCKELLIAWDFYLLNTGQEFFRMGADGLIFYWYNPPGINPERYLLGE